MSVLISLTSRELTSQVITWQLRVHTEVYSCTPLPTRKENTRKNKSSSLLRLLVRSLSVKSPSPILPSHATHHWPTVRPKCLARAVTPTWLSCQSYLAPRGCHFSVGQGQSCQSCHGDWEGNGWVVSHNNKSIVIGVAFLIEASQHHSRPGSHLHISAPRTLWGSIAWDHHETRKPASPAHWRSMEPLFLPKHPKSFTNVWSLSLLGLQPWRDFLKNSRSQNT